MIILVCDEGLFDGLLVEIDDETYRLLGAFKSDPDTNNSGTTSNTTESRIGGQRTHSPLIPVADDSSQLAKD